MNLTDIVIRETNRYIATEVFRRNFAQSPWNISEEALDDILKEKWIELACHRYGVDPLPIQFLIYGRDNP